MQALANLGQRNTPWRGGSVETELWRVAVDHPARCKWLLPDLQAALARWAAPCRDSSGPAGSNSVLEAADHVEGRRQ